MSLFLGEILSCIDFRPNTQKFMREEKPVRLVNRRRGHQGQVNKEFLVFASGCQYETFCIEAISPERDESLSCRQSGVRGVFLNDYLNMALISR